MQMSENTSTAWLDKHLLDENFCSSLFCRVRNIFLDLYVVFLGIFLFLEHQTTQVKLEMFDIAGV